MPKQSALFTSFSQHLHTLLPAKCTQLIIALSGGLDSMVLLYLAALFAKEQGLKIMAVNVDHGLSPNAKDWQQFCREQAQRLEVEFFAEQVEVKVQARQSVEALARQQRYQALAAYCQENSVLLTGHHNDDQLETYLLQLKRGAGVKGLSAMGAVRTFASGLLLRPLLPFSRAQLAEFAASQQISWIEDESNLDQTYDRNFLRHHIIPQLSERWPGFAKAVVRSANLSAETQQLCDEIAEQDLQDIIFNSSLVQSDKALDIAPLLKFSEVRRNNLLRHWIARQGALMPSRQQLKQIWNNLALSRDDACGLVSWSHHQMRRYQGQLFLLLEAPKILDDIALPKEELLSGHYQLALPGYRLEFNLSNTGERLRLPQADESMSIRFKGSAAVCHPLGRSGSRKFKKLMQEYHIPPWQRQQIPLIFYNEQLVAACGYWLDKRYIEGGNVTGLVLSL